ncbi:MAG: hypothetical protein IT436_16415 [Phycisphaerales bacterium]|nr:hypothetical protein [Phycisphaerales bacterium]
MGAQAVGQAGGTQRIVEPERAGPCVQRIEVRGDLKYMKVASEFRARLDEANRAKFVRIEVGVAPGEVRSEVIADMARAIRESPAPVLVELGRPATKGRVDRGVFPPSIDARCLALVAAARRGELGGTNLAVDWPRNPGTPSEEPEADSELIQILTDGLVRRGSAENEAEALARAAVNPTEVLWLSPGADGQLSHLGREAPSPDAAWWCLVDRAAGGGFTFRLRGKDAPGLRYSDPADQGATEDGATPVYGETIDGDPHTRRAEHALQWIPSIDNLLKNIDEVLDLPDPAKRSVSKDTYRKAGQRGLEKVAQTEEQIAALEQDLRDYPELLRTAPPGQTEVGAKPSSFAARWRSMIQSRRDKLAKLRAKAEAFAGQ